MSSGTLRTLTFAVTVADCDRWTAEHHDAAHAAIAAEPGVLFDCDDWAVSRLAEVMRAAGTKFIAEHPDVFKSREIV